MHLERGVPYAYDLCMNTLFAIPHGAGFEQTVSYIRLSLFI